MLYVKKQYAITFCLSALISIGSLICISFNLANQKKNSSAGNTYIGSKACMNCHKEIYNSYLQTAHYLTSSIADEHTIKGSFKEGKNVFEYNKFMQVKMQKVHGKFFQSASVNNVEYQTEPFDIVIGSARKGQTYLYWRGKQLYQLPVSYYKPLNSWCNSPGYSPGIVYFDRVVPGRCIECHGTYAKVGKDENNDVAFDKNSIIYGIDCERCHGPAEKHVEYQTKNPQDKTGRYIINAASLSRLQQLDACALCHSGIRQEVKPVFTFQVGDILNEYSLPNYNTDSSGWLDVHGNQYGLLTSSKCFITGNMNCSSCHNVHKEEINEPRLYSERCMTCHQPSHNFCTLTALKQKDLINNCIDCHMPLLPSEKIFLQMNDPDKSAADLVRTHHIAVYPEQTKAFIERLQKK